MMAMAMSAAFPREPAHGAHGEPGPLEPLVVARCRQQDPVAFRAFVVRHERMVFALLSRVLGRGADVEDLAQETFVRAYRAFPSFDPDGPAKVSTWLLTIATRLALDVRKKKPLSDEELEGAAPPAMPSAPDLSLERRELGRAIADAAARLPDDQRAALILSDVHGLSLAEIGEALGVPEATAKTKVFRAREKMRAALGGEWRKS